MTGGVTSAVHRLTVERGDGSRTFVVLRQYQHPAPGAEAGGRRTDPWWDLLALAAYDDSWRRFIPIQAGGRVPVDAGGMTARVEDLIESVLGRL